MFDVYIQSVLFRLNSIECGGGTNYTCPTHKQKNDAHAVDLISKGVFLIFILFG